MANTAVTIDDAIRMLQAHREAAGGDHVLVLSLTGSGIADCQVNDIVLVSDGESTVVEVRVRHPELPNENDEINLHLQVREDISAEERNTLFETCIASFPHIRLDDGVDIESNVWKMHRGDDAIATREEIGTLRSVIRNVGLADKCSLVAMIKPA